MATKLRVLSIDDNHQNLNLIQQALEQHFDVISSSGEESIEELIFDCEPDIILLDIMLAETNGYDICRNIRKLPIAQHTIVVFISSLHSLQDKLKAYEAGGDDYICKPVNVAELEYKLEAYEKRINEQQQLSHLVEEASQAALSSSQQASEFSLLNCFLKSTLTIYDLDELYQASQTTISGLGLSCAMEFRLGNTPTQYPKGQISQLESEILELSKRAKRVVSFGHNVLFNSPCCSLLIKKIPDNKGLCERLQEHFLTLLEIINSRITFIQQQETAQQQRQKIVNTLKAVIMSNHGSINADINTLLDNIQ